MSGARHVPGTIFFVFVNLFYHCKKGSPLEFQVHSPRQLECAFVKGLMKVLTQTCGGLVGTIDLFSCGRPVVIPLHNHASVTLRITQSLLSQGRKMLITQTVTLPTTHLLLSQSRTCSSPNHTNVTLLQSHNRYSSKTQLILIRVALVTVL